MVSRYKFWRCLMPVLLYRFSDRQVQETVKQDVDRNLKWDHSVDGKSTSYRLAYMLIKHKEFRNVFYLRMRPHPHLVSFCRIFLKDIETVEIGTSAIGGGFMISHYHSTIRPKRAGKNLRIGPGVVIGKNRNEFPIIGDNVYIASNATVIGGITIGDNVIIGAGSVVTKDIPSNSVYVGNPARFVRSIDEDPFLQNEIC